jgi:hypothetical protein
MPGEEREGLQLRVLAWRRGLPMRETQTMNSGRCPWPARFLKEHQEMTLGRKAAFRQGLGHSDEQGNFLEVGGRPYGQTGWYPGPRL